MGAWGGGVDIRGDGKGEGRREGLGRDWGSGMVETEEGWIWEQGSIYLD